MHSRGFWWGHDGKGGVAFNGNPTRNMYGFECPQLTSGYNCSAWGSNMSLTATHWSPVGRFRSGGAIGFDDYDSIGSPVCCVKMTVYSDSCSEYL